MGRGRPGKSDRNGGVKTARNPGTYQVPDHDD